MSCLAFLLLLAVATSAASESRIVGGSPTVIENYPSLVQIERSTLGIWRLVCAGGILTSRYVMSTASCFIGPDIFATRSRVRAGSTIRNTGGQVRGVERILKHPSWNVGLNYDGDLVLVLLQSPLQFTAAVQQGSILGQGALVPDNFPSFQVGWGMTFNEEFPGVFATELQELNVITFNNNLCAEIYSSLPAPRTVTANMICAISGGDTGACLGDRGAPLYANNIIVGLVSWSGDCANRTLPTVHTAVPSYTSWIIANAV